MRCLFIDAEDMRTVLWEADLPAIPRLDEMVKLPSGVVYEVYTVEWVLIKEALVAPQSVQIKIVLELL